ncbi:MAG: MMPL family transporter [Planctomycetes bacterium]|nr:MMPL family transporter [Planctomycetota bacterium]
MVAVLLARLAGFCARRAWWVIGAAALLTVVFAGFAATLKLHSRFEDLFSPRHPAVRAYEYALWNFRASDFLVVVVESDRGEEAKAASERLRSSLQSLNGIDHAQVVTAPRAEGQRAMIAILLKPAGPPSDITFARRIVGAVQKVLTEVRRNLPAGVSLGLTGAHKIVVDDQAGAERDLVRSSLVALVGVIALFIISFRMWTAPLLVGAPLIAGVCWTLGITRMAIGRLNLLTSMFPAILFGLGVDYAIHTISALQEGRERTDFPDAVAGAMQRIGPGLLVAGLTTAGAFYALCFAELRGLSEMGFIGGTGMIVEFCVMVTVLPALLSIRARRGRAMGAVRAEGLARMGRWISLHARAVLVVGFVVTLALGCDALHVKYEYDMRNLRASGQPSVLLQDRVARRFGLSFNYIMVVADDMAQARRITETCQEQIRKEGLFRKVESLTEIIPQSLSNEATYDTILSGLPSEVKSRYVGQDGKLLVYLYPAENPYNEKGLRRIAEFARGFSRREGALVTGSPLLYFELIRTLKRDVCRCSLLAAGFVAAVLLLSFRSLRIFMMAAAPLAIGMVWMLGLMAALGVHVNLMNAMMFPLIIGLGIDDGVHITHRLLREGNDAPAVLRGTGRAVIVTSLTTLVAFGTFILAENRALASVGYAAALGIGACLVAALTVLPALARGIRLK